MLDKAETQTTKCQTLAERAMQMCVCVPPRNSDEEKMNISCIGEKKTKQKSQPKELPSYD